MNICQLLTYVRRKAKIRNRLNQASHRTQDKTINISNKNDPVRIERTVHVYIYCICLTSAYGEILFICNIRHRYQKRFKVHFSVWNWRLPKMNEENVMRSAGHRKIINNIKRFVRITLKLPTKKISRKHTSKISKEKNLSFMSS